MDRGPDERRSRSRASRPGAARPFATSSRSMSSGRSISPKPSALQATKLARIAVAWIVFQRTHSPLLTGISYAVTYLPWLIGGPLGSVYADRHPRRLVMIVCDASAGPAGAAASRSRGCRRALLLVLVTLVAFLEPPFCRGSGRHGSGDRRRGRRLRRRRDARQLDQPARGRPRLCGRWRSVALVGAHGALVVDAVTFALSALVATRYVSHRPAAMVRAQPLAHRDSATALGSSSGTRKLRWLVVDVLDRGRHGDRRPRRSRSRTLMPRRPRCPRRPAC